MNVACFGGFYTTGPAPRDAPWPSFESEDRPQAIAAFRQVAQHEEQTSLRGHRQRSKAGMIHNYIHRLSIDYRVISIILWIIYGNYPLLHY